MIKHKEWVRDRKIGIIQDYSDIVMHIVMRNYNRLRRSPQKGTRFFPATTKLFRTSRKSFGVLVVRDGPIIFLNLMRRMIFLRGNIFTIFSS